jgi:hopene-associated glycosyltransferase HpnB
VWLEVLTIYLMLANLFWLAFIIQAYIGFRKLQYLRADIEPASTPKVSIIVPARNESRIVAQSLQSLLNQDYPDFEIILIDDHSEDKTFEIASALAEHDSRLRVVRSVELPGDWRGKAWANQQGAAYAKGNWLLFTDADIQFHPSTLRLALANAQKEKLDFLSIVPHMQCDTFWSRVVLPGFAIILNMVRPIHQSNDPTQSTALAAGGFILTKTLIFRHENGYHRVRESMAEDVRLAELYKKEGYKIRTYLTRSDLLVTPMYDNFVGLWDGLSRHAFEGSNYSPLRMCAAIAGIYLLIVTPAILGVLSLILGWKQIALLCAFPLLVMAAVQIQSNRFFKVSPVFFFSFPVTTALYGLIMMNSMVSYYLRGGNHWKGRRYRKQEADRALET